MINLKNVTFSYTGTNKEVLKEISLNINQGGITTLLGLNGSGKTTLIKLLVSIYKPTEGNIKVNGTNISELSIREKSKLISYVPQLVKIDHDFLVFDYLTFSLTNQINNFNSPTKEQENKVLYYAKEFNIEKLLNKKINNLSGGERQIVTICSAFIQDTPIIILDEPTSALDLKNQSTMIKLLKDWNRKENKTFILSTHNPNHALSLGGDVIILHESKILAFGESRKTVTIETLKPMYGDIIDYASNIDYNVITTKD